MSKNIPKVVSLLPSTTEIVCALGMQASLIGRSHECDYPTSVTKLPACTEPKFKPDGTSYDINQKIKSLLQEGLSIYRVDADILASLDPDIIITQDHCEVCAASLNDVKEAVYETLGAHVTVISVSPTNLEEVHESIRAIADALEVSAKGEELIQQMKNDFDKIKSQTRHHSKIKEVSCIEWLDPMMTAGNWVPELVDIAGGRSLGAEAGKHSPWIDWQELSKQDPETICLMPCGYSIDQTLSEIHLLENHKIWNQLKAVHNGEVYILDGNQYFNRPGPRLTDSARILAEILHPGAYSEKKSLKNKGWIKLQEQYKTDKP